MKKDFLVLFILSSILSFVSIYIYFSSYNTGIEEIKGVYSSIDFVERSTKTTSKLKINLRSDSYSIPSYLEPSFKVEVFKKEVLTGDSISIFIDEDKIITQIKSKEKSYIVESEKNDLISKNSKVGLIIGLVFLMFSIHSAIMFVKK